MDGRLGERLRAARLERGFTLRSVASAVGVSPSLLSQVENAKTQPSVSTLYALVSHLGVSIDTLLGRTRGSWERSAPPGHATIQAREDALRIEMEGGVVWERLAVDGSGAVDPLLTTYEPGGSSSAEGRFLQHAGVEYGYMIAGELTLRLDDETHLLGPGDSVCFDSMRPHLYVNHTNERTVGLWFVVGGVAGAESPHAPTPVLGTPSA